MAILDAVAPFIAAAVAGTLAMLVLQRRPRGSLPLPPGPRPLPLIGNLLDMPKEKDWLTYRSWNDQYGDVVHVDALGQKIVVLGSAKAVNDLLGQRGSIYSDRPSSSMSELMDFDWSLTMLPYGDTWRRKRKLMTAHIHAGVAGRYHAVQLATARRFVRDLLAVGKSAEPLHPAVSLFLGQLIIKTVYGIDVEDGKSEYITYPELVMEGFSIACTPGKFMVNFLPFLKWIPAWFPGAGFQRFAQQHCITQRETLDRPIAVVKSEMANGTAPPSMVRTMLEDDAARPSAQSQLDVIKDVAGLIYIGGADTTASVLLSFFLAMLVFPEVQAKAQAEVDRVVGSGRLPDTNDKKDMPYVQAVVSECLRWMPVAPTAVPHQVTQDDEYNGYLIPKGTIVIGSVWSILHNAEDYPQPDRFLPERFLTPEGELDPSARDPRTACFGFGRRVCPGRFIADATLFIAIATLLATVDVVRAKDADGVDIVPEVDTTTGIVCHAKPFPWSIQSRSQEAEALLATA